MKIDAALSEPAVRLVEFHNAFNRNIKVSYGALKAASDKAKAEGGNGSATLPTGGEPWGRETRWRDLDIRVKAAAVFLAEMGIARATAAFEDYLTGAKAEFDRAGLTALRPKADGTSALQGLDAILGIAPASITDLVQMANFFDVARNCVVHRSNRASRQLVAARQDTALAATLERWPKRIGKWTISLPLIKQNEIVEWQPRHAIMASDVYYRCATMIDRQLMAKMSKQDITRMASHWCFFADPPAPCHAKLDAGTMIRSQLTRRYLVEDVSLAETIALLKEIEQWQNIRAAFAKRYPDGAQSSLARRRRARKLRLPSQKSRFRAS